MSVEASRYGIELVNSSGLLLADLTGRARNRQLVQSRNEAEDISWTVDLNELERYCRLLHQDPTTILIPGSTEVRIKRRGTYLAGGQLTYVNPRISSSEQVIELRATGFLNLFNSRYTGTTSLGSVTESFAATQATSIAATLVTDTQTLTNGNFGVTIGALATVGVHDRSYSRTNIKDALQNLTKVQTNAFDFEFTYDKVFNTYVSLGSSRPEIIFEYPNNIVELSVPNDATSIANQITALGQGFGEQAQTDVEVNNAGSQLTYRLRQNVIQTNGTDNSDNGITDAANAELAAWAFPYELPTLTVDGNVAPYVTDYGIGDRVRVLIRNYQTLTHINGLYRVEKRTISIDDEDNESVELILSV